MLKTPIISAPGARKSSTFRTRRTTRTAKIIRIRRRTKSMIGEMPLESGRKWKLEGRHSKIILPGLDKIGKGRGITRREMLLLIIKLRVRLK